MLLFINNISGNCLEISIMPHAFIVWTYFSVIMIILKY